MENKTGQKQIELKKILVRNLCSAARFKKLLRKCGKCFVP